MKAQTIIFISALLIALAYISFKIFVYEKAKKIRTETTEPNFRSSNESNQVPFENAPQKTILPYVLMAIGGSWLFSTPITYAYGGVGLAACVICLSLMFIVGGWFCR